MSNPFCLICRHPASGRLTSSCLEFITSYQIIYRAICEYKESVPPISDPSFFGARLERNMTSIRCPCPGNGECISPTTISSSIAEDIKSPTTFQSPAGDEGLTNYHQPPTNFGPVCNEALPYHHQPSTTFRSPADNEGQTNYHRPPATSHYHPPREKANGRKATYFSMKAGKGRSAIPTVKYIEHPNFTWLPMKEKMSLDEAFRAIHNTQDLPAGADQIISSFKEEYVDRCAAGFWAFWEEDRIRADFSPCVFANHLRDIWRLTRYCGHKIRLLDANGNAVVRLATLEEDLHQLGVTIFYQHDDTKMYKQRYIDHHYG